MEPLSLILYPLSEGEIFLDSFVLQSIDLALRDDRAGFDNIVVIGDGERKAKKLFDQEDGHRAALP